jgi:ASC-1-like (ASCH) protein
MEYRINVSEPWFTFIKKGKKRIEGRLKKGVFAKLNKGDTIFFVNGNYEVKTLITHIYEYSSFLEYLTIEGLRYTLPNIKTLDDGVNIYYKYYTKEDEKKLGILAIHVSLL